MTAADRSVSRARLLARPSPYDDVAHMFNPVVSSSFREAVPEQRFSRRSHILDSPLLLASIAALQLALPAAEELAEGIQAQQLGYTMITDRGNN
jgi:hypothetical protein